MANISLALLCGSQISVGILFIFYIFGNSIYIVFILSMLIILLGLILIFNFIFISVSHSLFPHATSYYSSLKIDLKS